MLVLRAAIDISILYGPVLVRHIHPRRRLGHIHQGRTGVRDTRVDREADGVAGVDGSGVGRDGGAVDVAPDVDAVDVRHAVEGVVCCVLPDVFPGGGGDAFLDYGGEDVVR